jgi:class 3 adenylate cyclase
MSMMFADLRDFTSLAERFDQCTVMDLLNRYFVSMEPQISNLGGFVDSFSGDEIKALFDTSADHALRAGIGMWKTLDELNRRSASLGQPELRMGIGINTGLVLLGVVGGPTRMQCSFIGDTANLASRIEELTKFYKSRLLIGESTFQSLVEPDAFAIRLIDRVAVKGKNRPIDLYEVIDADKPEQRESKLATQARLSSAMESYFARQFQRARQIFMNISYEDPDDAVASIFAERCKRQLEQPPPDDWGGFERFEHK